MQSVVANMTHNGSNSYVLTMYMNEPLNFAEGGMEHKVKVMHRFLSHSVSYNYRDELTLDPLSAHTHLHHTPCHKFCLLCIIILHFYMIYAQARSAHRHTSPKIKMLGCKNF
jgi:hypothetical protein